MDVCPHRYAQALLQREMVVLTLEEAMLGHEVAECGAKSSQAEARAAKARTEVADAEIELARVQAEGPANHRKKDLLDKVSAPGHQCLDLLHTTPAVFRNWGHLGNGMKC